MVRIAAMRDPAVYTEPDAFVVILDVSRNRAQPVVAGVAAASFDFHLAGGEVELVVENVDVRQRNFEKALRIADGAAAIVHIGFGFQERDALGADRAF